MSRSVTRQPPLCFLCYMKTTLKNRLQKWVAAVLVLSVGLLIVNNVVFLHTHKLPDGSIVVHAHPYNKSDDPAPFKKHNHTSKELFHSWNLQLLFISIVFPLIVVPFTRAVHVAAYLPFFKHATYIFILKGRDPPFSSPLD